MPTHLQKATSDKNNANQEDDELNYWTLLGEALSNNDCDAILSGGALEQYAYLAVVDVDCAERKAAGFCLCNRS